MLGRTYATTFAGSAQTAQVDFFELNVAATKAVELLELHLSQLLEIGDAMEENLLVSIKTGATVSGSGGAAGTAVPRQFGDPAYAGTVETNNTTKANTGTIVTHENHYWNVRVPFQRIWIPEATIVLPPSARLTVELGTTPLDTITFAGTLIYREIG